MPRNRQKGKMLSVRPVFHVFCEGEKTEPNYLAHYKDLFCNGAACIKIERTNKNTPVELVKVAASSRRGNKLSAKDEYWVVYDRESPAKYPEELHARARDVAKSNGINIALSNVCFEVWLLLHEQKTCASCNSCDELLSRPDFKKAFPHYEKGEACVLTRDKIANARRNAAIMNKATISGANTDWDVPSKWNPYTDMHKLLDAIDGFLNRNFK